jgi:hypothetical protein
MKRAEMTAALLTLQGERNGVLRPEDVVEAARPIRSPLHDFFEWDDTAAAREYRLWQARQMIRVSVILLPGREESIKAFVSLMDDRSTEGGGYRALVDVMNDNDRRSALLEEALAELRVFERKYSMFRELAEVIRAARHIRQRVRGSARVAG